MKRDDIMIYGFDIIRKELRAILNDFLIVACASIHEIVNGLKKYRVPIFIPYIKFKEIPIFKPYRIFRAELLNNQERPL